MIKTIKRVILSSLSILLITCLFWTLLLLNPKWSYAHETEFGLVTVYHNQQLDAQTNAVLKDVVARIQKSALYNNDIAIQLCLNDDPIYPSLHPLAGQPLAYAFLNKTVIRNCNVKFNENVAETQWAVNNHELRKFNLTWLLAHEFTHNLQNNADFSYVLKTATGKINWKLEGHADYIGRGFKNDGALKSKIENFLLEEKKEHTGLPVFELEDGTKQIFSYYKYALVIQYLLEEKKLSYKEVCELETGLDQLYMEMVEWSKN